MTRDQVRSQSKPQALARLSAEGLACRRGDRWLFSGLNFVVEAGGVLEVAGANGSGKTTLLRLLCGLLPPDEGEIYWCGQPILETRARYMSELAYVGHTDAVKGDLTALENLMVARALNGGGGMSPTGALTHVGLAHADRIPARLLSAGQRRRLALARLLTRRARLWLLDEPFTALDKEGVAIINDLLSLHVAHRGIIVFTSHHRVPVTGATATTIELPTRL